MRILQICNIRINFAVKKKKTSIKWTLQKEFKP